MRRFIQLAWFPSTLLGVLAGSWLALAQGVAPALLPLVFTVATLIMVVLGEQLLPRVRRPAEPRERWADLGFLGLTAAVSDPAAQAVVAGTAAWLAGILGFGAMTELPLAVGVVAVLLVHGLGDYWAHRLGHQWGWWWKLHAVHHAPHRMVALNNLRLHPLDLLLKVAFGMGPVLLMGFTAEAIAIAGAVKGTCLAFQHADIDLRHAWLNAVFATNSVHRWHHSAKVEEGHSNYGGVLSIFDRLFGTYAVPPEDQEPARMGLFEEAHYPVHSVVRANLAPLCWRRCVQAPPSGRQGSVKWPPYVCCNR